MVTIDPALREVCQQRLGIDLCKLSDNELRQRLPAIVEAVKQHGKQQVAKTAHVYLGVAKHIPNGELVRDEQLGASARPSEDLNSVFDSMMPTEG